MSDNFENKDNQTSVEPEIQSAESVAAQNQEPAAPQNDPAAPVNGAYHYRTYDLQQQAVPQYAQSQLGFLHNRGL